jgi:hypothetical protein
MKGHPINYTPRQLAFIKRRRKLPRRELYAAFVRAFPHRKNVSVENLKRPLRAQGMAERQ